MDNQTAALARDFRARMARELGRILAPIVDAENKARGDVTCATHDFFDANEVMLESFEAVYGRPVDFECDSDGDAMEDAWNWAKEQGFAGALTDANSVDFAQELAAFCDDRERIAERVAKYHGVIDADAFVDRVISNGVASLASMATEADESAAWFHMWTRLNEGETSDLAGEIRAAVFTFHTAGGLAIADAIAHLRDAGAHGDDGATDMVDAIRAAPAGLPRLQEAHGAIMQACEAAPDNAARKATLAKLKAAIDEMTAPKTPTCDRCGSRDIVTFGNVYFDDKSKTFKLEPSSDIFAACPNCGDIGEDWDFAPSK